MSQQILISVCIPTYSRLNYLKQAVQSAIDQTYENIEICISQNPKEEGPDISIKAWCEMQASSGIIKYNLNKKNLGLSGNLNVLSKFAAGNYMIFLGDDDMLANDFVSELVEKISESGAAIGFTNQFFINKDGNVLESETKELNHKYKRDSLNEGIVEDAVNLIFDNSVALSASLICKDLFSNFYFNENLNTPELPFFLRVALDGKRFVYSSKQLAYYRLHKNSETSNGLTTDELLKEIIEIPVPPEIEQKKFHFISENLIPAINKALVKGNFKTAKLLVKSTYYPQKKLIKLLQQFMIYMPLSIIKLIFKIRRK